MTADITQGFHRQVTNLLPEGPTHCAGGSVAHGMGVPKLIDSIDDRTMDLPRSDRALPWFCRRRLRKWKESDCVLTAVPLACLNGNPNVLDLLWLNPNQILYEVNWAGVCEAIAISSSPRGLSAVRWLRTRAV